MDDLKKLKLMRDGDTELFNMVNDGGAEVHKFNGIYFLFEIPLYGGKPRYYGHCETEEKVIKIYSKWT